MATLKNTTFNDTGHIRLPSGTEGQRPSTPQAGMMRYNNSAGQFEAYAASGEWQAVTLWFLHSSSIIINSSSRYCMR